MPKLLPLLIWLMTASCLLAREEHIADESPLSNEAEWQADGMCGVNATYMLLRYHGKSPPYPQLVDQMSPADFGSSLKDVKDALRSHGLLEAEVVEAPLEDLLLLGVPIIIHQEFGAGDGHYAIVFPLKNSDGEYATIDGLECQWYFRPVQYFAYSYSGYAVLPVPPRSQKQSLATALPGFLFGVLAFLAARTVLSRRKTLPALAIATTVIFLPKSVGCTQSSPETPISSSLNRDVSELASVDNDFNTLDSKDLQLLANSVKPYWQYRRVSDYIHALRLWGPEAEFPEVAPFPVPQNLKPLSSKEMLSQLLNTTSFADEFGPGPPLIVRSRSGALVRINGNEPGRSVAHVDDLLAVLAEIGITIHRPDL